MQTALLVILFLLLVSHLTVILSWLRAYENLPKLDPATYPEPPEHAPLVSVIVPARNEEKAIERCVRGVLSQDWPRFEAIVVDDRSTDRTPEILARLAAADPRLHVIPGEECPPGWMGKNHALATGYRAARGEWLLFLDADTTIHPAALTQTVRHAIETDTGLLTLVPGNEFRCFWDRVVNPLIFQIAINQQFEKLNDPTDERANANGPFMLFRRDCYEAIGGHAAIPYEVVEDLVLARNVKAKGYRLRWALAPKLMKLELYESLRDLRRGWGKILQRAMEIDRREIALNLLGPVFLLFPFFVLPWVVALASAASLTGRLFGGGSLVQPAACFFLSFGACATSVACQRLVAGFLELPPIRPWLQALGALVLAELEWESVVRLLLKKKMHWKGREYAEAVQMIREAETAGRGGDVREAGVQPREGNAP